MLVEDSAANLKRGARARLPHRAGRPVHGRRAARRAARLRRPAHALGARPAARSRAAAPLTEQAARRLRR
ncbi:MAG: hypothetical protein MZW92_39845 [Comamonadaceae bacterium]|nr:hypothetical protein [Comamonadaceae bacterium]